MINLSARIRKDFGKKVKNLRKREILPAVLYGPARIATQSVAGGPARIAKQSVAGGPARPLEVDLKEFEKVYKETGESSLISLEIEGEKEKPLVLIHEAKKDPLTGKPIHVDFYQPKLDEEITATIPLVFEGESQACKDLGGTLIRNIHEVEVKALPQNLPHEIKVNVERLKTFEDNILIKDLIALKEVKILKEPNEIVALVAPPEKAEEELGKPAEKKAEEVEKVGEKKEKEETHSES